MLIVSLLAGRNGGGTPDASINGGQSITKSSAAELLGDVVCYVRAWMNQSAGIFGSRVCDGRIG